MKKPDYPIDDKDMKTCDDCGKNMRYSICIFCGWMDPKTRERDRKLKLELEQARIRST